MHVARVLLFACVAGLALANGAPCQQPGSDPASASVAFVRTYIARWSSSNAEALAYMDTVFGPMATYFDQSITHGALMRAKRRFTERWPVRQFAMRDDGLSVTCQEGNRCTVWGLVDWHCSSPERHADATGTSAFVFQLQDAKFVVDEDGFVVARGRILPPFVTTVPAAPASYSNADIPVLREAFFSDADDRNWITKWLAAQRRFSGTARSLGQASSRDMTAADGSELPYAVFESDQGPIACMMTDRRHMPPPGEAVHVQGTVAIFIDKTMYLSRCTFG
jgi:hypothetical protein